MKTFQRILAIALALIMSLSVLGTVAFADDGNTDSATTGSPVIDENAKGSITVYKYEYNGTNPNDKGTGLESESSKLPMDKDAPNDPSKTAIALEGVTFKIYQVKNTTETIAYYNGEATESVTVASFLDNGKIKSEYSEYTEYKNGLTTGGDGKVEFTNLPVGMYVIVESAAPENVTKAVDPFLVSIPMTHPTNLNEWMYDVYVYPKNSTSEGNVTLKKLNEEGNPLAGVTFKLEKGSTVGETTTWTQVGNQVTTTANGQIDWNGLAFGDYRITEVSAPDGYIVDKRPIEFTVTQNNTITCDDNRTCISLLGTDGKTTSGTSALTITLKNEKPDVTKTLADGKKKGTVDIGDTVSYKVTVDVPSNITDLQTFTLTDTPTNLNDDSNTVAIAGLTKGSDFTVADSTDGNGFTITFITGQMGSVAGTTITVTYDAVVLASAADATAAPNTVNLTYSDSIVTTGEPGNWQIEDGAVVYTYKLGVIKYKDAVGENNKLANVEFSLYTSVTGGNALNVVEESVGTYRLATTTDTTTTTTLKTDTAGKIVVKGLDNGTYYLEETKTASGYNLLKGRVEVDLEIATTTKWTEKSSFDANGKLIKKTFDSATHTSDDGDDATTDLLNTTIINKKGFDLPQTGGIGTLMFFIIGGVLIAGGICLITVPNKKHSV